MSEPAGAVHCLGEVRQQSGKEETGQPGRLHSQQPARGVGSLATGLMAYPASTTLVQTCLVCRKGDNDEFLLLCDGCDRGCHIYCHRPKMEAVPEGDWFCAVCLAQVRLLFSHSTSKQKSDFLSHSIYHPSYKHRCLPCLQSLLGKSSGLGASGPGLLSCPLDKSLTFCSLTCFPR